MFEIKNDVAEGLMLGITGLLDCSGTLLKVTYFDLKIELMPVGQTFEIGGEKVG